jgi:hypothetical protein
MAGRWIDRGGPIIWSPTPSGFFLWVYVKNTAYLVKINDLEHLKARMRDVMATVLVTPIMLQAMWNKVKYCLDICRATKGAHTEIS